MSAHRKRPSRPTTPRKTSGMAQLASPRYPWANLIRARLTAIGMTQVEMAREVANRQITRIEQTIGRRVSDGERAEIISKTTESNVYKWTSGDIDKPHGIRLHNARGKVEHETPSRSVVTDICLTLGVDPDYFDRESEQRPATITAPREFMLRAPAPAVRPSSVPIRGRSMAGKEGALIFSSDDIVGYTDVPAEWSIPDAYAVYVHGDSMLPIYRPGNILIVNPHAPPAPNEDVVVQISRDEGATVEVYVKRFIAMDSNYLTVMQFTPERRIRFPRREVVAVHPVEISKRR